jgi:hypothetical protein
MAMVARMVRLSRDGFNVIAECISRGEHLTLDTQPPVETGLWCENCCTHSGMILPVQGISDKGVYDLGLITVCPRCLKPKRSKQ